MSDQPVILAPGASPRPRGRGWALVAVVAILSLLGGFIFFRTTGLLGSAGGHVDRLLRDAFVAVAHLQPKVTVDERVVYEQTSPALELATVQRDISVERETTNTWLGSTKRLRVRAVYRVKAGFDLRQPFEVRVDGASRIAARLPPARLLSAEQVSLDALDLQDGIWNHVEPAELKNELNALNTEARVKAINAGLPREAETMLAEQLRQKLGPKYPLEITFAAPASVSAPRPLP